MAQTEHLPGNICITYSSIGQPTVTAPDEKGVAWGQGYISALHRFFQMDQQRRVASACMSELAGINTLELDRWICRLGLIEAVNACYANVQKDTKYYDLLQSYTDGVNFALRYRRKKCLGFEFQLLKSTPAAWAPKDTIRILTLVSWALAGNWEEQIVRLQTLTQLGPEQAALLEVDNWLSMVAGPPHQRQLASDVLSAFTNVVSIGHFLSSYQEIRSQAGLLPRRSGSNAWIVSGSHTESGKPIIAGDPHMPPSLPGLFFETRLLSSDKKIHAIGATIPGIPGIVVGRNTDIAWSITVSAAITAELLLERVKDGEQRKEIQYTIKVKGQEDVQERVSWGSHGPFLVGVPVPDAIAQQFHVSLLWTGYSGVDAGTLHGLWYMMQAKDTSELYTATERWGGPVLNLLWAEIEKINGTYGWRIIGAIPRREHAQEAFLPTIADQAGGPWPRPNIPAAQLPAEINPERGYLVSANHRMVPIGYQFVLSHEYISSYRAERIEFLLQSCIASKKYTAEDARNIQIDQCSEAALALNALIVQAVSGEQTPIQQTALNLLKEWDGSLKSNSAAAALFKVTEDHLYALVAQQLFPSTQIQQNAWLGNGYTPLNAGLLAHWRMREILLALIIARPQELKVIPPDQWPGLIQKAFDQAVEELSQRYGKRPDLWRWGQLHKLELNHPLVQIPVYQKLPVALQILKRVFRLSRGPYQLGGDEHTPWQSASYPVPMEQIRHPRRMWVRAYIPLYRFIATDQGLIYSCLPGGMSGHLLHKWSSNQLKHYLRGKLFRSSI